MALAKGTNCGFVTVAPTADPDDGALSAAAKALCLQDVSPVGSYKVTAIGWYQARASGGGATPYNAGIYGHDSENDRPGTLLATQQSGQACTADTEGWYAYTGLDIPLVSGTTYWIAVGLGQVGGNANYDGSGSAAGQRRTVTDISGSTLADPHGAPGDDATRLIGVYALVEAAAPTNIVLNIL